MSTPPGARSVDGRALRDGRDVAGDAQRPHDALRVRGRRVLEFATRGTITDAEGGQKIGNLFYGSKGWLFIDGNGRDWQSYLGRRRSWARAPAVPRWPGSDPNVLTSIESPHYQNFVDALRAGDAKKLNCDILEGHLSSTLPHLANIAYRVGRTLRFDGKTETIPGDAEANRLLTREYRDPYHVPERV